MKPIFVKIRNDEGKPYDSYADYWELIGLSGFETCELGEIDFQREDAVYIFTPDNGNVTETLMGSKAQARKCKLAWYVLEWPKWENGEFLHGMKPYYDEYWCPDMYLVSLYERINPKATKYVFMGGHKDYGGEPASNKIWDFCSLSYDYGERLQKMNRLRERGYTLSPPGWGEVRRTSLAYSKWGLALQQFNTPLLAPQRWVLFASWKLPILCDYVKNPYPFECFPEGLIHFDPKNTICGNEKAMKESAEWNYHVVKTRTFFDSITKAANG